MDAHDFALALIGSMADIRAALWSLVTAVGMVGATIFAHALIVTRRNRKR